jgi:hypothetical protein
MRERPDGNPFLPEREPQPNVLRELIEFQESFGFVETHELAELHEHIVKAVGDENTDTRHRLMAAYQDEALRSIGDDPQPDIRRGFALAQAALKLEAGYDFACLDDLEDILYMLRQESQDEEAAKLDGLMRHIEFPN